MKGFPEIQRCSKTKTSNKLQKKYNGVVEEEGKHNSRQESGGMENNENVIR